jgi:hypothetical protein
MSSLRIPEFHSGSINANMHNNLLPIVLLVAAYFVLIRRRFRQK